MRTIHVAFLLLSAVGASSLMAGPCTPAPGVWNEGDLGQGGATKFPAGANVTTGVGALTTICGDLSLGDSGAGDLYEIYINGSGFSATTSGHDSPALDNPALYLFDLSGNGLFANNDISGANTQAELSGLSLSPGLY